MAKGDRTIHRRQSDDRGGKGLGEADSVNKRSQDRDRSRDGCVEKTPDDSSFKTGLQKAQEGEIEMLGAREGIGQRGQQKKGGCASEPSCVSGSCIKEEKGQLQDKAQADQQVVFVLALHQEEKRESRCEKQLKGRSGRPAAQNAQGQNRSA